MRFIHTADWHIGRMLYGKKRYAEFAQFLDWLAQQIDELKADALIVPGDIFDTRTPSNFSQQLYYEFLIKVSRSHCQHVVITSGNHDSPSFLDAPKSLLRALQVHVIGIAGDIENELIELTDKCGKTEAIIAAVPYLRDRDIRTVELGESIEDKDQKIIAGITKHYSDLAHLAKNKLDLLDHKVPVIAMGHLFANEGKVGDGVRDLYVGNLGSISAETFDPIYDYVALGHLHVSQTVGDKDHIRYSGSPIPMGYGEVDQTKEILIIDYLDGQLAIQPKEVPRFQELLRIEGELDELQEQILQLKSQGSDAWLEVNYTGTIVRSDLRNRIMEAASDSKLEIMRVRSQAVFHSLRNSVNTLEESLEDLTENEVFQRCLDAYSVPDEERKALTESFQEILQDYRNADLQAK